MVVANLTGALLVAESERVRDLLRPGGQLILSGFVAAEREDVLAGYAPPFDIGSWPPRTNGTPRDSAGHRPQICS